MAIRVALHHRTSYQYDKHIGIGPQIIRLRPAPHCRTPILSYSLKVSPKDHFINWQQDPHGNFLARYVFPEKADHLSIEVDLIADMTVINPFDFFIDEAANTVPFKYEDWLVRELRPFLETEEPGPHFQKFLDSLDRSPKETTAFLVALNSQLNQKISYLIRMEPGVQTPEETLSTGSGSCRDTGWLLVQTLRHLGLAARFVSGYLIQLTPDVKSLDGPTGTDVDFTDLHAWAEVYIPGAGWIGLDPTSGLFAGEGHIPLACTPDPQSAAPITGGIEPCESEFDFSMTVTRIHEDARVTKPYSEEQWSAIDELGRKIDERLTEQDVRLTIGGEPTFVSIDDMEGAEWNSAAVGLTKRRLSEELIKRCQKSFAPGGLLHYGQGKWYPGESLPRWSLDCYWRKDGVPIWTHPEYIADSDKKSHYGASDAKRFLLTMAKILGVTQKFIVPAYEDAAYYLMKEQKLPINVDPRDPKLSDPEERARIARVFQKGLSEPTGYIMPIKRQWWQARSRWVSGHWPFRGEHLSLLPGDSPIGLRLPIESLYWVPTSERDPFVVADPSIPKQPLPASYQYNLGSQAEATENRKYAPAQIEQAELREEIEFDVGQNIESAAAHNVVRTALCVEPRDGRLHFFMPPVESLNDYLDLAAAVEATCVELNIPVVIEGYHPPDDPRINKIKVTPDPGVIEVNIHPAQSWDELVSTTTMLYEEARLTRLGTEKFDLDGKHTGTGGGNHVVLGSNTPLESPFLRRPDLLKSLLGFWINHPSLSYLFSGRFIGPTSQAPRVDEGRRDSLYELALAFSLVPKRGEHSPPWLVDRLFRNLLTDLTGNTHRSEFCIDKLFSPDSSTGRLGLVELRGFEMPPHAQMSLTQQLLVRALVAAFWEQPYEQPISNWGTSLHDRFMLPHFIWSDFGDVLDDLSRRGITFDRRWFAPHFEFRFQKIGETSKSGIHLELRNAIEPWYVLGEEPAGGSTARFVDSSVERLEVKVQGLAEARHVITCNGRRLPMTSTGVQEEFVAGLRYRAWAPASCLHPTIPVHTPLVFDILDTWSNRSLGGCMYHVSHPAGRNYATFPVNGYEAEARRAARFFETGHTPGTFAVPPKELNPEFPLTLDLRRAVVSA
ncbi:DUF2126 domain-containing protein [Planctomicrobium sp. SH668]|uniref:transglutaminase family protein n=1 Tax=Planctomicrobium sp. SH668 TaxID=3448126 RepID=UPI003F5B8162